MRSQPSIRMTPSMQMSIASFLLARCQVAKMDGTESEYVIFLLLSTLGEKNFFTPDCCPVPCSRWENFEEIPLKIHALLGPIIWLPGLISPAFFYILAVSEMPSPPFPLLPKYDFHHNTFTSWSSSAD